MPPELPPPDPSEPFADAPHGRLLVPAPMAVFLTGPPTPESDRLSDAILDLRPGALFVVGEA